MFQPNPQAYTFTIVALAAAIFFYILALAFERVWKARRKMLAVRLGASIPTRAARPVAPEDEAPGLDAPPGGACAAREAECVIEGASSPLAIRCPEHGTPAGKPCLHESKPLESVGPKLKRALGQLARIGATTEIAGPEEQTPAEADPNAPIVGQVRARHVDPGAPRALVLEIDPKRPGAAKLRGFPPADMDEATATATEEARTTWADADQMAIFWPVKITPEALAEEARLAAVQGHVGALNVEVDALDAGARANGGPSPTITIGPVAATCACPCLPCANENHGNCVNGPCLEGSAS